MDGETVQLSEFRGERVMLNFWATWCPPCRAEMPDMQKLYDEENVVILAVNMTDTESNVEEVENFIDEYELTFQVPMDEEADIMDTYQIIAYPTTFMIDSNGKIHNVSMGAMNHEQMLQQLEEME
ncbi:redoxin domain-containing protein [Salicibibacter cibi]|uniref:redoxin domain-containing protein n=1 Tax=Salicibibacter cibi TaxID=2743001 RepID=UPI0031B620B0